MKGKISVAGEVLEITPESIEWDKVLDKPFSTVDTESGLAVYDNTLMIDTLDHIATIDFVNSKVPDAPTADGTYTLQVAVLNGEPTYSWQPTTLL